MPYLIVTNGLTGSGKSSLVQKVLAHCGLVNQYTKYFIDDLIEGNEHYKASIDNLVRSMCGGKRELCPELRSKLRNPDASLIQGFNALYWESRRGRYCGDAAKTCEAVLDGLIDAAIKNKENMVFETTGSYFVDWLLTKVAKSDYTVYYAFTLVEFCENLQRNKVRAEQAMGEYVQNRQNPAPRLPDITEAKFRKDMGALFGNLVSLLMQTLLGKLKHGERLLVFGNTGLAGELMFDSATDRSVGPVIQQIEDLLHVNARCQA